MHTAINRSAGRMLLGTAAAILLVLTGCAYRNSLENQLVYSRAAVEQARISGMSADYAAAKDKLARATAAAGSQDNVMAMRLAEEAQVDAELALAKANAAHAVAAAAEIDKSNQVLRDVIERSARPAGARP